MDIAHGRYTLRARYLFPVTAAPLRDGLLSVADGRVAGIGPAAAGEALDLGNVAILPGLVNAHTHLEFTHLTAPLGRRGMRFADWISEVVHWRRWQDERQGRQPQPAAGEVAAWREEAVEAGLFESLRAGVTTLGEIAALPWSEAAYRRGRLKGVAFLELLGLADDQQERLLAAADEFAQGTAAARPFRLGLGPHAPYTVSPKLLAGIVDLAARHQLPLAMHLAESRDELQLLRTAEGPLVARLRELDAWHPQAIPRGSRPLDYLRQLAQAPRALIIHGNYLDDEEIAWLAQHRERLAIVFCPRTHDYFGHDRYRLAELLSRGVTVALGTDSRASSDNLDLLQEMRFVAQRYDDVPPAAILRMGTHAAAAALGLAEQAGSLAPGRPADFLVLPLADDERADPHELLFTTPHTVAAVFRNGTQVAGQRLD